jgi:hypothetical protein
LKKKQKSRQKCSSQRGQQAESQRIWQQNARDLGSGFSTGQLIAATGA